ncbi:helix-turn-helix domain-containing protein [Paenibacillus aceris]|uniref:AraC-like DNA-binding protein n=1 Tax=Paenibacillus aceris TaxID=869555 RepID=A0ABS4HX44_9BACL|nr:AraC family transcriptional regulator [Paenibacillus aceris]MBP1963192.1 AraC-like DNA-binding protein [Paenibacillus aceris]NHW38691.1 AraC family transcriptional regulator [Paenibacillus aceris]
MNTSTNIINDIISPDSVHLLHLPNPQSSKLPFRVYACGHYHCLSGYRVQRQGPDNRILILTLAGSGQIIYRGQKFHLTAGHAFLIDCNEPHIYECVGEKWEIKWVRFEESAGVDYENTVNEGKFQSIVLQKPGYVEGRIDTILEQINLNSSIADLKMAEALCGALTSLCEEKHVNDTLKISSSVTKAITETIIYIDLHYNEDLSIKDMAKMIHLTAYAYIRTFKRQTGLTPYEYLLKLRITKARMLLEQTDNSVNEISEQVGFNNVNNFIRKFKDLTNTTPLKYRQQNAVRFF